MSYEQRKQRNLRMSYEQKKKQRNLRMSYEQRKQRNLRMKGYCSQMMDRSIQRKSFDYSMQMIPLKSLGYRIPHMLHLIQRSRHNREDQPEADPRILPT